MGDGEQGLPVLDEGVGDGGTFAIGNVWVPGVLGDYMRMAPVTVEPGGAVALGDLVFEPPRSGPTLYRQYGLWERYAELYPPATLSSPSA
ncbi:hypothetical protein ZWY2020_015896 [Hordeum vulgare]|nr:hypothetical protein ZWY2020_015896 [Hordeum vulgare]